MGRYIKKSFTSEISRMCVRWLGNDVLLYQRVLMTTAKCFVHFVVTDRFVNSCRIQCWLGCTKMPLTHITKQDHRQDDWISIWPYSHTSYDDITREC